MVAGLCGSERELAFRSAFLVDNAVMIVENFFDSNLDGYVVDGPIGASRQIEFLRYVFT